MKININPNENKILPSLMLLIISAIVSYARAEGQTNAGISFSKYLQEIKSEIQLPENAGNEVLKLYMIPGGKAVVTASGVFRLRDGKWTGKPDGSGWKTAAIDYDGNIWLASVSSIKKEGDAFIIEMPAFAGQDSIRCIYWENKKNLLIGTSNGVLSYDGTWTHLPFTKNKRVNAILKDRHDDLWIATTDGLLRRIGGKWVDMDDNLMAYGLKRTYYSLENDSSGPGILFGGLFSVGCIAEDGDHWIKRGADGLPYGPITTIRKYGKTLWLGTFREQ